MEAATRFSYNGHCQEYRYFVTGAWSAQSWYSYFESAFQPDCQHIFQGRKGSLQIPDALSFHISNAHSVCRFLLNLRWYRLSLTHLLGRINISQ